MTSQGPRLSSPAPPPPQVGAPDTVMSPQPAAREGGGGEEEDGGEGPGGTRDQDGGHLPRTRPAAGSGAASRSSRGPRRPPHGPRQTKLLPWLAPAGRAPRGPSTSLSGRGPAQDHPPGAAAIAAAEAAAASAASLPPGARTGRGRHARGGAEPAPPPWSTHQAGALWSLPSAVPPPPPLSFTTRVQDGLTRSPSGGRARSWACTAPHKGSAFAVAWQMDRGDLTPRLSSEQGPLINV